MAKYEVKFSCGHTETITLFGKVKERESKIAYYEKSGICSCCYEKQEQEKLDRAIEEGTKCEVVVPYKEYIENYRGRKTKRDSYDSENKTIVVIMTPEEKEEREALISEKSQNVVGECLVEVTVKYKEYKNKYYKYKTKADSYNKKDKTIIIFVPSEVAKDVENSAVEQAINWQSAMLYGNQIKTFAEKAVLIKMPLNSEYKGYVFWHPAKLVTERGGMYELSYNDTFEFKLKKYGQGRSNYKDVIAETTISADEFAEIFGNNGCVSEKGPLIHTPDDLEPEKVEVPEELKEYKE